ncbi:hypothetical protein CVO77_08360 [Sphingopyxis lindanitolerans]|uniref:Microcin J25-processing protein McjB C-terminal domain-containing protein n=4 Tax=Sphingomonadaceae TaxID=41297 RepID=A0A246JNN8_9SPHN|nr:hypothetical protein CDQ91_16620 [Sphingopyxis witflariensis]PQM28470.1 hypothetical protein CVO77_08360 [Sphingopyxis lindanitolerans]
MKIPTSTSCSSAASPLKTDPQGGAPRCGAPYLWHSHRMDPSYDIRPGLHFCRFESEYVFLDLPAGRYFLIQGRTSQAFAHFLDQRASDDEQAVLLDQQLIGPAGGLAIGNLPLPPAVTASLIDQPLPDTPWLDTLRAIAAQRRARFDIGRIPVFEITRRMGERLEKHSPESRQETYIRVAAAFHRARRYALATDRCLERGIAMRRILARARCDARLVFGVTLPFAAHCWVQAGEAVLTDPLDVILRYKPILAV